MSQRAKMILLSLGLAVAMLLIYFFVVKPAQNELGEVHDQVSAEESRTQSLTVELNRLKGLQENAPQLQANLDEISEMVPRENQVPNFIFQVQEAADQAGLDFVQVTPELPKSPPEGAQLAEVRATIAAKGGYFTVQDFIRRLYDLDRALRVDNFTLAGEKDDETEQTVVSLQMSARIFFELPEGSTSAVVPGTTAPETQSPTTETTTTQASVSSTATAQTN